MRRHAPGLLSDATPRSYYYLLVQTAIHALETFKFTSALYQFVLEEGTRDYLDPAPNENSPFSSSPLTSLCTTPECSRPSSPVLQPTPILDGATVGTQPVSASKKRKNARNKEQSKKNKRRKRQEETISNPAAEEIEPPANSFDKHATNAPYIQASFSLQHESPVASTAYVGLNVESSNVNEGFWLSDLVQRHGFTEVQWDGRTSTPIIDLEGTFCGLLAGRPHDAGEWDSNVHPEATRAIKKSRNKCSFTKKQRKGRRGNFPALTAGVAHGGGRTHPANVVNNSANTGVLDRLARHPSFQRMSGFANGASQFKPTYS
ncbi:hypothetical protein VKT23_006255 [Stygiomarasmius scandens]|uniref:HSF-type DNA-binding domain-containing protein n=1 Tax=Marasmiellus scandens TaxID=2682957 RepID=A0ABR1JN34_9AGAR